MNRILRFTSFLPVVALCRACGTAVTSPDSAAAVMLGEWSYAAPHRIILYQSCTCETMMPEVL